VVTAATRGIGRRVALALAEKAYAVAANHLDAPEDTLRKIEGTGARAVPNDVSDEESVRGMVETVARAAARLLISS